MKSYGDCACGEPLTHVKSVQCRLCTVRNHPGSSQCPFCLEWYYTHSGSVTLSNLEFHAKKKCR